MSQMRKDTFLSGYGILQELSGHVLYIHRIRTSTERHVGGIQGKEISVLPLQEGTSRTGVQTVPANRKVVHLLKSLHHGKINGSLQHLLPLRRGCVKSKNQVFFDILYKKDFISLLC